MNNRGQLMSTTGATSVSLDQVLKELPIDRVDFVKMDVDGHEHDVILGARESLAKFRPRVLMELVRRVDRLLSAARLHAAVSQFRPVDDARRDRHKPGHICGCVDQCHCISALMGYVLNPQPKKSFALCASHKSRYIHVSA